MRVSVYGALFYVPLYVVFVRFWSLGGVGDVERFRVRETVLCVVSVAYGGSGCHVGFNWVFLLYVGLVGFISALSTGYIHSQFW